ncbi:phospholipase D-like domain-containing protein [Sphingomonas japonica]|uniref:Phospholipase D n=1 Tax=Sphingomonas japonica TaxID=511662 RepID=A0ABX0TYB7_9SPHN|nr:phosphatidylserine/phosphatidylglycerophosphate/cardiolipin synthase family protein [Sphingomonas japonica]NIJ23295.1 cardiolipin synthase [Sphingomonas japonica]
MDEPPPQPSFDVAGHRLTLLDTGPRRLRALLDLIAGATATLRILYYIYEDDSAGRAVRDALIAARRRGIDVAMIVDGLGSEHAAAHDFFESIASAGIDICRFVPRWGRKYLVRNHQKLAIADEARVIIGGFNIKADYFGVPGEDGEAWRDLGMLVEGPAASHIAGYFEALSVWSKEEGAQVRVLNRMIARWSEQQGTVRWLLGGPTRRLSPWARAVKREIEGGRRIDMIAAYFAPTIGMLRRLRRAARRGSVRIVLPSVTDNYMAIWASRFTYRRLLKRGVGIYEYQPTKLHTKLFVIDDVVHIGSANFDVRSLFLNLEVMLRIEDAAFAAHVRAYFDGEVAQSRAITAEEYRAETSWWMRVQQAAAYFMMAVVDLRVTRGLNLGQRIPWRSRRDRLPPAH